MRPNLGPSDYLIRSRAARMAFTRSRSLDSYDDSKKEYKADGDSKSEYKAGADDDSKKEYKAHAHGHSQQEYKSTDSTPQFKASGPMNMQAVRARQDARRRAKSVDF